VMSDSTLVTGFSTHNLCRSYKSSGLRTPSPGRAMTWV